ncbi:XrtA/PEP-CTERM system histidine kinase PrsK [Oceanicoccus sagamiensis]|uniref:histidine kinase n=1 Tax=Oceanicoccus sagamiensis TaxID=716816 RepID=A0A1X9NA67_9GAMM|nr:XrtA/PEP-CTERM system histidine kinase PrsK [Oceanicoccus sagamiensis]ARN74526.1 histidine kinase [Oceanicoccus sagamiensis]
MQENYIAYISYSGGGASFALLTIAFAYLWKVKLTHYSLIIASATSTLWNVAIAANYQDFTLQREYLLVLETLRYGAWIAALLASLQYTLGQKLELKFRYTINGLWLSSLALILLLTFIKSPLIQDSNLLIWNNLVLSIVGLVSVEQLYRNTSQQRLMKLISVGIGALFAYDIYLFSYSLIFNQIDLGLWQSRGAINGLAALALLLGSLTLTSQKAQRSTLSVSRPVAFYTTSMSVAGGFLALIAIGGYYVQLYGGRWGSLVQVAVLFGAILSIVALFVSSTIRSRINVWINKHFFRHKYDYRAEWLGLISSLAQPTAQDNFHERAIKVVASIFKSEGGSLWLQSNGAYRPVQTYNMENIDAAMTESIDSPFCKLMIEQEWVFSPHGSDRASMGEANSQLPSWIYEIPDLWLVMPLLTEKDLLGFMVLKQSKQDASLTWEDLDLLKTVGRQVASYLDRHEAAEQLARSKQFDAFNKLTAFIMHDLKNLIAQQALVVENAAKHKENPAFVEDAIKTIDNSVSRMSNLLRKLQQQEASEIKSLQLHKVLMEAAKKCQDNKPSPSLRLESKDIKVVADQDHLIMVLANIIKNAQEATDSSGFVDVTLRQEEKNAIITIEDNGTGMDKEFIRHRLFKPFDTTKSGKGMGIGVYQTQEFISDLGGSITVDSILGEGSTFTISIPASAL